MNITLVQGDEHDLTGFHTAHNYNYGQASGLKSPTSALLHGFVLCNFFWLVQHESELQIHLLKSMILLKFRLDQ